MILYPTFPREIAFPERRLVADEEKFLELVHAYTGKKNIYYSIYDTTGTIDKVFFDFDSSTALEDARKLVKWCIENKYKHCVLFSGKKGFHVYVFCHPVREKSLLRNAHLYISQHLHIHNDVHITGDTMRIARLPNTYHLTGQAYCIALTHQQLFEMDFEKIKTIANQPSNFYVQGSGLLNLTALPQTNNFAVPMQNIEVKELIDTDEKLLQNAPQCVLAWLTMHQYATHRNRFYFAVACRDLGLSPEETAFLAQKYYGQMREQSGVRTRYQEFRSERAIEYAFGKNFIIPTCDNLISCGACPAKCNKYTLQGYPLYKNRLIKVVQ